VIQTGSWAMNPDTGRLSWSPEMYPINGFDPSEGQPTFPMVMERIHPEDRADIDTRIQHAVREGSGFEGEYRIVMPEGGTKRLRYLGHPIALAPGKPKEYVGTTVDVTSEETAQGRVSALLDEMRALVAWMTLAVYRAEELARMPHGPDASQSMITPREREVVRLIAEANTSKQIASRMGIGVKTVESHRTNIMRKLQLHSATELVRYAIRNGIAQV
jgi:DNA-binding CsgD family transcriptional regulator